MARQVAYWVRRQLTAAAGFEAGKNYLVVVKATVDSVAAITQHTFQVGAKVNTTHVAGTAQTAGDLAALVTTVVARLIALTLTTGAVATDGSNSATSFKTDLSSSVDNFWNDALLLITSGALAGQVKKITDYDGTSKFVTVETGFTSTPADAVTFAIINR